MGLRLSIFRRRLFRLGASPGVAGIGVFAAYAWDISSPRVLESRRQTWPRRSLGGKGFGDSANAAWFCPFSVHILSMIAKRPVSRSLFVCQNDRHHAARFAFLFSAHPWALRLSALFFLCCPPRTAHCLLLTRVLTQSHLTCPSANTRIRSNTVWPRIKQVRARYRTQANRKQWDLSRGKHI